MPDPITRLNAALEGRYRIESELGEGGMATVYLADDLKHERKVALKVLKPELAAVVGAERFLAEIKTTANLQHPHILPLFDSGEADSFLFYVMPYVEGETLRDRLNREHQLPVDQAVKIASDVAEALQAAHEQGVIHRDIKPANILLSRGRPLVADFGIALAVSAAGGGRLTETGLSLGTPHYMSPEQATGDAHIGPATDVYALGCVLYEMLVGEPPHTGSTPQAVLGKIITEAPPQVTKARKTVPPNVEAAVARALEKLPADRFRDAAELAKALVDPGFRHGLDGGDRYALTRKSRVAERLLVPLTLATLLLGGLTVRSALQPTPSRPVVRFSIPVDQAFEHGLAISPDGSTIVLGQAHSSGGGAIQFEQRRLESLAVTPIPGTEGQEVWSPSVSPDGSEVAYHADGEIRVTPLGGGASRTIAGGSCCPFWAQDGSIYFQEPNGSIQRVESPGGPARSVTNPREGERHGEPWLLSGGEMGVLTVSSVGEQPRIESVNLSTGERQTLTTGFTPQVTASGHLLFGTLDGQLMAAPIDLTRAELEAPPVAVVEGMAVAPQQFVMYDVSESGTLVYLAGTSAGRSEFVWANRSGQILPVDPGETFGLIGTGNTGWQLSPDDSTVAFRQLVDGKAEIWTKALPDGPLSRLTFGTEADVMRPTWTPDGEWVTYFSGPDAQDRNVWRRRADGVGEPELVYDGERSLTQGVWSSDGQWLILRTGATAAMGLGLRDIVGLRLGSDTTLLPLVDSEFVEGSPSLSPDGRWLAYESDETGQFEIYVRPFPNVASTRIRVSSNGGLKPVWAHSGRELFFADASGYMVAAEFDPEEGRVGELDSLFQIPGGVVQARGIDFFDVSSDDQRFLMVRSVASGEEGLQVVVVQNFFEELKRLVPPN